MSRKSHRGGCGAVPFSTSGTERGSHAQRRSPLCGFAVHPDALLLCPAVRTFPCNSFVLPFSSSGQMRVSVGTQRGRAHGPGPASTSRIERGSHSQRGCPLGVSPFLRTPPSLVLRSELSPVTPSCPFFRHPASGGWLLSGKGRLGRGPNPTSTSGTERRLHAQRGCDPRGFTVLPEVTLLSPATPSWPFLKGAS